MFLKPFYKWKDGKISLVEYIRECRLIMVSERAGYAPVCKTEETGSIPVGTSNG